MLFVFQRKDKPETWEVRWQWMPFFIAADTDLIKAVDESLTTTFVNRDAGDINLQWEMHQAVITLVVEKHPIPGLRSYLEAISSVEMA